MEYSFDCSQLVAVRRSSGSLAPSEACRILSEVWDGEVKYEDQIDSAKVNYLRRYNGPSLELFEFVDKEFIGEFEDWHDANHVPRRVEQFEDCIKKFMRCGYGVETVFIINTPTESQSRVHRTASNSLLGALYAMSLFYTDEGAGCEVLIVNLKKCGDIQKDT
ncbi:hypothetical protein J4E05_16560 [Thalassospira sp. NFXS8]|uniref:hypothetical protein n=1 Tax=Thalassospira sp. NFXS8 TaxID=2819093 RepID=UPI0032DFF72F